MYCTIDDIRKYLSDEELIQLSSDGDSIDTALLNSLIDDAGNEVDLYLQNYETPLDPVPDVITKLTADMVILYLYDRRGGYEQMDQKRKTVFTTLDKIRKGELLIKSGTATEVAHLDPQFSTKTRIFD